MAKVTANKTRILNERFAELGSGISEVLMAMAIVAMATPLVYHQVSTVGQTVADIATANKIIDTRDSVLNFIRMNQYKWPDVAQIRLTPEELDTLSDFPVAAFVDKYETQGATQTDVYLAFDTGTDALRTNQIAKHIGADAAVVGDDNVAYANAWAVSAPDFLPGNLIYRISRDFVGQDKSKYLHRGTAGEDNLNKMERNLNMGGFNLQDIGTIAGKTARIRNTDANFIESENIVAKNVYFSSGANMDGQDVRFGTVRVTGDMTGFRDITAKRLNDNKHTTSGTVIADRVTVTNSVNVSRKLTIKSDSSRTISGFVGMSAGYILTSYLSTEEMFFYGGYGLTVSGELLMSTNTPLKLGSWAFPSSASPTFAELSLSRATIPTAPNDDEFKSIMSSGWKDARPVTYTTGGAQ